MIKHLDGREVKIESEDTTQPGSIRLIEEEGMPVKDSNEKGNMYVKINVFIPDFDHE